MLSLVELGLVANSAISKVSAVSRAPTPDALGKALAGVDDELVTASRLDRVGAEKTDSIISDDFGVNLNPSLMEDVKGGVSGGGGTNTQTLSYKPSSGVVLQAQEGKTTTILGSFQNDMREVVSEVGNVKNTDFGPKPGGFNVLNVPDELYRNPKQFWTEYNQPWLSDAINRGDNFLMATRPGFDVADVKSGFSVLARPNPVIGKMELSGLGREYLTMKRAGYSYESGVMVK